MKYTQRQWDREIGWGKVPEKYKHKEKEKPRHPYWEKQLGLEGEELTTKLEEYKNKIKEYFDHYEEILKNNSFFMGEKINLVDIAIMPFVRQGAHVDLKWFGNEFPALYLWLEKLKREQLFLSIMLKYDLWKEDSKKNIVKWQ